MRPPGSPAQLEQRRRRAVRLLRQGQTVSAVARQVQASVSSVGRWRDMYQREGERGLVARPTPGRPSGLSPRQKAKLVQLLVKGPLRAGYATDLWTLPRVAKLIHQEFGIRYHPGHVWKLLTALGWSCQKPERRALERDEAAIARWKYRDWPRIKKRRAAGRPPRLRR